MKKVSLILIILMFALLKSAYQQSIKECISCNGNTIDPVKVSSAVGEVNQSLGQTSFASGTRNMATGDYSTAVGFRNTASGIYSFAGGEESVASGQRAFAYGQFAEANGSRSLALGKYVTAHGGNSVAIGRYVDATASDAMIIGLGYDYNNHITNNIPGSLMIGFDSNIPTLYISPSFGLNTSVKSTFN